MSLSAERIAVANRAITQTFARCSIAWQAIPHWETGDPAQARVRSDVIAVAAPGPLGGPAVDIIAREVQFQLTLAQAMAPTPDALLAAVQKWTVDLARKVDKAVLAPSPPAKAVALKQLAAPGSKPKVIVSTLIDGRMALEDAGYRGPSCLIASTPHFQDLNQWVSGTLAVDGLLQAANINSLYRSSELNRVVVGSQAAATMIMLGRRQDIPHGGAASASPGEEPVDLAVSVPPSLEVVGDNLAGQIELAVHIRFATRIKDPAGFVVFQP
jgi:hypothetical protein